ncbi:MAG: PEGA domain-containing protein [Candidatus Saccharibacteria bacterium]
MSKRLLLTFILLSATALFVILLFVLKKDKPILTGFDIVVVPSNSQIYIDGKGVGSGINEATPGKHSIVVKRKDFATHKSTITASNNKITAIPIGLEPTNDAGNRWKLNNKIEYLRLDGIVSKQFNDENNDGVKAYPITAELPKDKSPFFRIDYGKSKKYPNDSTKIALYISANTPANIQSALGYVYNMGYDPSDYEIIFESL